ncbi:MAG: ferrous iron transporter B [Provencibacterium sp.]|jgi:ferrous iron transport protein B|nr:ferrous iron transporter B [Provencibacterium sp.]
MEPAENLHTSGGKTIALMGNPNVGKSTLFNYLTGLRQHTGNWPGKTVAVARGEYLFQEERYTLVDLPGTYSLSASSPEEEIARDYLCFDRPDAAILVADAITLERGLSLLLQTLEITPNVVLCVNLMDEARRKGIRVDTAALAEELGIPVVAATAAAGAGVEELCAAAAQLCRKEKSPNSAPPVSYGPVVEHALRTVENSFPDAGGAGRFAALKLLGGETDFARRWALEKGFPFSAGQVEKAVAEARRLLELSGIQPGQFDDWVVGTIGKRARALYLSSVQTAQDERSLRDLKIDRVLTSRRFGIPVMLALLCLVFWLTISGANYPSALLSEWLFGWGDFLGGRLLAVGAPAWLHGLLILGMYRTLAWVISVMLPPMAIFFPLFTLLEDLGYLPRVAFNLDNAFYRCGACGKQALTMCMGFGCNAAGVTGCRIISSPRERLIAILTNCFVPCNGRFPPPEPG